MSRLGFLAALSNSAVGVLGCTGFEEERGCGKKRKRAEGQGQRDKGRNSGGHWKSSESREELTTAIRSGTVSIRAAIIL
ncbi:hypothetical protein Nepgr_005844 [Nepenthes gracilis]|uniref:Secreted protein n=1 Tax=Nepenthes gracilis TaxID=150966 RepID=A0AAD3XGU4_NEPGR|nr:hypothetical protein Nepgr_005844 [Nepenthes gracilis]